MSKSVRIRTKPGDDGYIKVNVDLEQDFDFLEILSLKILQVEDYQNFCADYGIIAGRVIINNGFGVPNVNVSVFIPINDVDADNEVIKAIYPYTAPTSDQKNRNGIRYNLLPNTQQTLDHTPVGTFPQKREILDNGTTLEIYEKYYKYTTTTNKAGDYALFGIPVGEHTLHYDMDVSNIGFLSARPYELIAQGYSEDLFEDRFTFKSSNNLDSLAQIFSENIPVTVEPYWCDSLSVGSVIGINRKDIYINNIELTPNAIFFGSIFSDDEKDSLNKNCNPDRDMGKMNEVITNQGKLEAIRRTIEGEIETFEVPGDAIDENGNWSLQVPMNMRKVVTDEFGNLIPSPDGIKGVATEGDYRFRVSMEATDNDKRLRERAKFLVPNMTSNYTYRTYSYDELKNSQDFKINKQLSTITSTTPYSADTTNQYNYLEDFYTFRWKKVYTVKQYIGRYQKLKFDEARSFIGIKDIYNAAGVNKFPTNRADTGVHPLYTIICVLVSFFAHLVGLINAILQIINGLITALCQVKLPVGITISLMYCFRILKGVCNGTYKGQNCSSYSGCDRSCSKCNSCKHNSACDKDSEFHLKLYIKWKCIFGKWFCKNCVDYCDDEHSCCVDLANTGNACNYVKGNCDYCNKPIAVQVPGAAPVNPPCCKSCCIKIPLIKLRCQEENKVISPTIIKSPFADPECNQTYVKPFCCKTCGGRQTPIIKDWVSCVMEPIAVWLKMLKFDFYNDWVNGSLYFPLIKRKYKVKKSKRKFGQIKKDKYCDFHCIVRQWGNPSTVLIFGIPVVIPYTDTQTFQGPKDFPAHRIKIIKPGFPFLAVPVTVNGCTAKVRGNVTTQWYGALGSSQGTNLNNAAQEINLKGKNSEGNGCRVTFDTFAEVVSAFDPPFTVNPTNITILGVSIGDRMWKKNIQTEHGKPEYVKSIDPISGVDSWKNIGGHGHHKNICNTTRLAERSEYFKDELDCLTPGPIQDSEPAMGIPDEDQVQVDDGGGIGTGNITCIESCYDENDKCPAACCKPDCGSNGVAACNAFCPCNDSDIDAYKADIKHGYVTKSDIDKTLYYTSIMKPAEDGNDSDPSFNTSNYKANLFLPVDISELGSSTYCDIDDIPFVMDQLAPTTFQVSYESLKYKLDSLKQGPIVGGVQQYNIDINKIEDKDGSLNLRAYVEFSCIATVCLNTMATVNHSQLGVDLIDKNDLGIEIGNCFMRFEHDQDLREYFCKRFSGYKNNNLDVHYMRPGSLEFDNDYQTYPEMVLSEGYDLTYTTPEGEAIISEYNDGEPFIPGDACGFHKGTINPDYFYGLAPGVTSQFIKFPNTQSAGLATPQPSIDDVISQIGGDPITLTDDDWNYVENGAQKSIRFSTSQTPYYFYFGLVPGKTSLHKTVGKFFADKINEETLQGIGDDDAASENKHNQTNINNTVKSPYSIFRTCLGDTELAAAPTSGFDSSGDLPDTTPPNANCTNFAASVVVDIIPTSQGASDAQATASATGSNYGNIYYLWSNGQVTATATGLAEGTYTVIVSDYECEEEVTVVISAAALQPYQECYLYGIYWKCHYCDPSVTEAQYTYTDCSGVQQTKTFYKNCPEGLSGGFQICSSTTPENFPGQYVGYESLHFGQLTFAPAPNCIDSDSEISTEPIPPPNYTITSLNWNPSADPNIARGVNTDELIYNDGVYANQVWGVIKGGWPDITPHELSTNSLYDPQTAFGTINVDFSQTQGPAVVNLTAFVGTKLHITEPIWTYIGQTSYANINPYIWVTFGLRKVQGTPGTGNVPSTYDNTPPTPHNDIWGVTFGFCQSCGEPPPPQPNPYYIPEVGDPCISLLPGNNPGQEKFNPFGPGLNYLMGESGYPHKPWKVTHSEEDVDMAIYIYEEGTYEYIFQVHAWHAELTERDGFVKIS